MIVYVLDEDAMRKLREIQHRLHAGSDKMRDEGHKLWLALNTADAVPFASLQINSPKGLADHLKIG